MNIEKSATKLSKNPLGIISLFIVLIYGFATLLFGLSGNVLSENQKWCFVIFLVSFPCIVLFIFTYLVVKHHQKLYAPGDYREDKYFFFHGSQEEKEAIDEKENQEENLLPEQESDIENDKNQQRKQQIEYRDKIRRIENLVYEYYEKKFNYDINRNIYYLINNNKVFFDGVVEKNETITFLKIKYFSNTSLHIPLLDRTILNAINTKEYLLKNGNYQIYRLLLTIVVDTDDITEKNELKKRIHNMFNTEAIDIGIRILSVKQLEDTVKID